MTVETQVADAFAQAGVTGTLHARDVDRDTEVGYRPDELSLLASVFKVPVLVELARQADAGLIDLGEQVTVPAAGRTPGTTGLSVMTDPVTMSWRDLARLMIVVSDNAASDVVLERVGIDRVNATLKELGCTSTEVVADCADLIASMLEDGGVADFEHFPPHPSDSELATWRAMRPAETNRTTPRDMTHLLGLIARDEAASPEGCALVRQLLQQQVWPHRLASGFPEDDVVTAGKTGTLPRVRNESGLVLYPDGRRFAVSVFTTSLSPALKHPEADAVIGRVARIAVDALLHGEDA
jgi:beta-lactamase class A